MNRWKKQRFRASIMFTSMLVHAGVMALDVVSPVAGVHQVVAGDDFSTSVIADAWDMESSADVQMPESRNLSAQGMVGGVYSATSTSADPYFFALHNGVASAVATHNGHRHPIDTAKYRYLTAKLRVMPVVTGTIPPAQLAFQAYFYRDQDSISEGTVGCSPFAYYQQDQWQIVTVDMQAQPNCGPYSTAWTDHPKLQGLRIDPVAAGNARVEVDWIRLTAPPTDPGQSFLAQWTDISGGHSYAINAVDTAGARFRLATGVTGNQHLADMSRLPPGSYRIELTRTGAASMSPGSLLINAPPQLDIQRPNMRGDQSRNYALVETGNPWGPVGPEDIQLALNLVNISYTNPAGSFTARPTNHDPYVFFAATAPIDAEKYRTLCYTLQVHGTRDIGAGSVARIMWGQQVNVMTTTDDIVVEEGLNERCLVDLAEVPDEGAAAGAWSGLQNFIRIDPHEFPVSTACTSSPSPANCRDIRIDAFVLSPFFEASPGFEFQWQLSDPDHGSAQVSIHLDTDRDASNGKGVLIGTVTASTGAGSYHWPGGGVASGEYHVYIEADDGLNGAGNYASGPLLVSDSDLIFAGGFESD